jgi:SAM-dependent methyltransferase
MNEATRHLVEALNPADLDVLEISGSNWADLPFRSHTQAAFPDFDICNEVLPRRFDLIIAEQVFEHVRYPARAARNVQRMLHKGAFFLITTPFFIKIHREPLDLWRWTPEGLKAFLEDVGFTAVQIGSWGNRECVLANFNEWTVYEPGVHSLVSEPDFPLVVWALVRRAPFRSPFRRRARAA